jgi:hypothetical protein
MDALAKFRGHEKGYYIIFQHIRKAGGTSFCDLVKSNFPDEDVEPPRLCKYRLTWKITMAKLVTMRVCLGQGYWRGSLLSEIKTFDEFYDYMAVKNQYRVAMNEWDAFFDVFFSYAGAIFVTEFRDPLERWYSQYVFEHLEYRTYDNIAAKDTKTPRVSFQEWYKIWPAKTMGENYYVRTFIGKVRQLDDELPVSHP